MKRAFAPYEWPEGLYPLRDWLARKGVDVTAMKSARQVLWMAKQLGRQKIRMPKTGQDCFPALLKVQGSLCPRGARPNRAPKKEEYVPGTFGAASEVRHIDPAEYLKAKEMAA